jgi:hypothetical protein
MSLQTNFLRMGGVNALLVGTLAISAPAQALSALSFSGNNISVTGTTSTRGFAFNVLDPNGINVTDLSIYDENGNGLSQAHDIGLWNSAGMLLASATVSAGTVNPLSANGLFRTVAISNILLPQGTNYAVGAVFLSGSLDRQAGNLTGLTTPAEISYVTGRFINNGVASLTFPTSNFANGIPGGSFEFVPVTPVPFEFSPALGLSVLGGLWIGKRLIKKFKASKKSD